MTEFTVYEKLRAADRETRLRRINRMKTLDAGGVVSPKAEYQIKCMQEIADEYRAKWDGVIPELTVEDGWMT